MVAVRVPRKAFCLGVYRSGKNGRKARGSFAEVSSRQELAVRVWKTRPACLFHRRQSSVVPPDPVRFATKRNTMLDTYLATRCFVVLITTRQEDRELHTAQKKDHRQQIDSLWEKLSVPERQRQVQNIKKSKCRVPLVDGRRGDNRGVFCSADRIVARSCLLSRACLRVVLFFSRFSLTRFVVGGRIRSTCRRRRVSLTRTWTSWRRSWRG